MTSDPERNVMGQSTEISPLVSMLFWTFLNLLKFLMEIFNILVYSNDYVLCMWKYCGWSTRMLLSQVRVH